MALAQVILTLLSVLSPRNTVLSVANPISEQQKNTDVCNTAANVEAAQFLLGCMDTSADPCHDFFRYACGGWVEKHPIPDEKSSYSVDDVVSDELHHEIAELLRNVTNESHVKPIIDATTIFQGCMDEDAREIQGLDPLKSVLNSFGGWPMMNDGWSDAGYHWQEYVAVAIRKLGIGVIVGIKISDDPGDSLRHMIKLDWGEFGLDISELLNLTSSESNIKIIDAYKNYIISTGKLLNPNADETQLNNDAEELIQFESSLAQLTDPPRREEVWEKKMNVSDADEITENKYFKWVDFLNNIFQDFAEVRNETEIIITQTYYMKNALKLVRDSNPRVVANYIGWILLNKLGNHTTRAFRNITFHYDAVVSGVEKPPKLETVCSELTDTLFGFAVGRLYVDKYFTEQEKRDVEAIVDDLRAAYEVTLTNNTWVDWFTRDMLKKKVKSMTALMGYPEWIKHDKNLSDYYRFVPHLERDEFFMSMIKAMGAAEATKLKKWNQPVQKNAEWDNPPSVVNAFYNPMANTIEFPAGILKFPFYKYGRSIALNYGMTGTTIGHEIAHGLGPARPESMGVLPILLGMKTNDRLEEKSNCFRRQYSSYVEPKTNTSLNGYMTLPDDIADNGGLRNAFLAYKARVFELQNEVDNTECERLPGISATPDQLFFLGYASMWCWHGKEEAIKQKIEFEDHTLDYYRAIVPISNSREFAEAFNCPLGSPMNPESKCVLW